MDLFLAFYGKTLKQTNNQLNALFFIIILSKYLRDIFFDGQSNQFFGTFKVL